MAGGGGGDGARAAAAEGWLPTFGGRPLVFRRPAQLMPPPTMVACHENGESLSSDVP